MQEVQDTGRDDQANCQEEGPAKRTPALDVCALGRIPHTAKVDPDMGAAITTRADHTMHIRYPTGDSLVLWPDGSRTTVWSDGTWTVECEGIPCVRGGRGNMSCHVSMDTQITWNASAKVITLEQNKGPLVVAAEGLVCGCTIFLVVLHLSLNLQPCVPAATCSAVPDTDNLPWTGAWELKVEEHIVNSLTGGCGAGHTIMMFMCPPAYLTD